MERLRSALSSSENGDQLLALLESQSDSDAAALSDAFLKVLEEKRLSSGPKIWPSIENDSENETHSSRAVAQFTSIQCSKPKGTFDVIFCQERFELHPVNGRQGKHIVVPYSTVDAIAMVMVPGEEFPNTNPTGKQTPERIQDEGYLFIHLQNMSVKYGEERICTLQMQSRKTIPSITTPNHPSEETSENEVLAVAHQFHQHLAEDRFDTLSSLRARNGACFFLPIYNHYAVHVFLMERAVCCGRSGSAFYLPHSKIVGISAEATRAGHFTLKLHTNDDQEVYQLKRLPLGEKATITDYFRSKKIPISCSRDLLVLRTTLKNDSMETDRMDPVSVMHRQEADEVELEYSPVIDLTMDTPQGTEMHSDPTRADAKVEDGALLPEDEELTVSENETDETSATSEAKETENEEQQQLLTTLAEANFPVQDDDGDLDYAPAGNDGKGSVVGEKRSRAADADSESEGCVLRRRCEMTDDDVELEEIDSEA